MHADDLFTAPQVAKICSTDLKTIHNWVNRGTEPCVIAFVLIATEGGQATGWS